MGMVVKRAVWIVGFLCLLCAGASDPSFAAEAKIEPAAQPSSAKPDPYAQLLNAGVRGPSDVALRDQAHLNLPQGFVYLPEKPAKELMAKFGNTTDEQFLGLILPEKPDGWFVTMEYIPSGYIKDDDAKNWNADEMLASIKEATVEDNKRRASEGVQQLEVVGWIEKPHYDAATHRLIWSIAARDVGADNASQSINYRTLMLGRQGYVAMVLVTDLATIEAQKPIANLLLSKLDFVGGKTYGEFNSTTDRVAEFGLGALIAGVAAKKLGLIALMVAFVAKFIKVFAVAAVAAVAGLRKFVWRAKPAPATANSMVTDVAPPNSSNSA